MPFEELVEAEGHLVDSHVMEQIFDKVVESSGRFEVEQFRIGRTNSDASYRRLRVETPTRAQMEHLLAQLLPIGCSPVEAMEVTLRPVERDKCAPECKSIAAEGGVAGGAPGAPAPYIAVGHLTFDSLAAFQKSFGPHAPEILADIPNYTNTQPIIQISEIAL